jgi:VWFA-related protein
MQRSNMPRITSGKIISSAVAGLLLACLVPGTAGQQSTQKPDRDDVIRIDTNLVQVRAVVTDRAGKLVDNLKQDDFEVLENGRSQTVSFFSAVRIENGSSPAAGGQEPAGVNRPSRSARDIKPARSIILLIDTLHLTVPNLLRAKQQLKQFVDEQVTDEDLVAIVTTSGSLGVLQQFMRDRRMLKLAIDKIPAFLRPTTFFTPYLAAQVLTESVGGPMDRSASRSPRNSGATGGGAALPVATDIVAQEEFTRDTPPPPDFVRGRAREILGQESLMRRNTWEIVRAASDQLAQMPGQRIMAFVSEGFTMLSEGGGADHGDFTAATSRAVRSGVVIYSFSPQGLTVPVEFTAATPVSGPEFGRYMGDTRTDQQQTLRRLAGDTGGEAYLNSNDVVGQFRKMLEANRIYYALAYYPEEKGDNKYRSIKVRVRNHPEYSVRAQRGYQPATEKKTDIAATPQQRLLKAMLAPLPLTNIAVMSTASFLARDDDHESVSLQVHFAGSSFDYKEKAQEKKYALSCEVAVAIVDRSGKVSDSFAESINADFTEEQLGKARQQGYRYSKRLALAPGLYQLRIGVRDVSSGLMGTSSSWVEVPDLRNQKLALSNIFLGKETAGQNSQVAAPGKRKSSRPVLLVGPASFKSGEDVFYRLVLYNAARDLPAGGFSLRVEVLQSGAAVYEGPWQPVDSKIIRSDQLGIEIGGQIRMQMPPGVYTLRITLRNQKSNQTVRQTTDLELE